MEIRHGRMTREEGIMMVNRYDAIEPSTLELYCDFLDIKIRDFYNFIEPMRELNIWEKHADGSWSTNDSISQHEIGEREEHARIKLTDDLTFSEKNQHLFFNPDNPPKPSGDEAFDVHPSKFVIL